ncbi:MAG: tetraacyldisaccharide 4'-kinase [Deltaproteobacteria bacterium]|nr:MAG: tetraacyldisaccharide 4'-kinase [Deltaproteobacteria bacterium]
MSLEERFRSFATVGPGTWRGQLLLAALLPFSWCYAALGHLRRLAYNRGWLTSRSLPVPVIAVGNLAAGGTGKTPVTEWLVSRCLQQGIRVAVVSRGYGGRREEDPLVVCAGQGPLVPPEQAGDEPCLLARRHPEAIVVVGADRYRAGMMAVRDCGAELVILDDGFQHRKLRRDFELVLLDARRPFGNGHTLPAGYLRETPKALNQADLVLLTRAVPATPHLYLEDVPCLRVGFRLAGHLVGLDGTILPLRQIAGRRVVAFCGIANPESFFDGLKALDVEVVAARSLGDHHAYPDSSVQELNRLVAGADLLLTTEKDAVKLFDAGFDRPCYYLPLELDFMDGVEQLEHILDPLLSKTRNPMKLSEDLLDILACPQCKQSVRVDEDKEEIVCDACRLAYPVRDDIPVMLVDEARNF